MTTNEEIAIILRRLPKQVDYIQHKWNILNFEVSMKEIKSSLYSFYDHQRIIELIESAVGVLYNLIERLNELLCLKE